MELIQKRGTIHHINSLGSRLKKGFDDLIIKHNLTDFIFNKGLSAHFITNFKGGNQFNAMDLKSLLHQELIKRKQLSIGSYMLSGAHTTDHIKSFLKHLDEVLDIVKNSIKEENVIDMIEGKKVQSIF